MENETSAGGKRESTVGTPRWVKVFGIIALLVVLLFVVLMVAGGGRHGPGRHFRHADTSQSGHR
ncbi:MAG TPA: hypothetical protein VGQ52_08775 [Gemmatimonadaceae bacterium]|jgi:ABC-type transporter Mla subunit MlaD|nr:hypothetical protein [Gemmatimonadaceae bacterium]